MSTQQNQENNQNLTEPDKTLQKNIDVELLNISKSIDRNLNLDCAKIIEYNNLCAESILEDKIELPKEIGVALDYENERLHTDANTDLAKYWDD